MADENRSEHAKRPKRFSKNNKICNRKRNTYPQLILYSSICMTYRIDHTVCVDSVPSYVGIRNYIACVYQREALPN